MNLKSGIFILILIFTTQNLNAQNVNFEWAKSIGGTGTGSVYQNDEATCIKVDLSGNIYITGSYQGTVDFDPDAATYYMTSVGGEDIFVVKLDPNGHFIWSKSMGYLGLDKSNSIAIDSHNNLYLCGAVKGQYSSAFIAKLDSSGNQIWTKETHSNQGIGLGNRAIANSLAIDLNGSVYATGSFSGTVDFDPGTQVFNMTSAGDFDSFIFKLDSSGNFIWAKSMGGYGADFSRAIALDGNGNIYTTGDFYGTSDFNTGSGVWNYTSVNTTCSTCTDIFISKLDNWGNSLWTRKIGGAGSDAATSIVIDLNGDIYATGAFSDTVDFDPVTGVYNLIAVSSDIFVYKLNSLGLLLWAKSMGGASAECGKSIAIDAVGNVYTTGYFFGTVDFDPSNSSYLLSNSSSQYCSMFNSKLDEFGNFIWAKNANGGTNGFGNSIAIDAAGNVYTTGKYMGTMDFDASTLNYNLTSVGGYDIFIQKFSQTTTGIYETGINQNKIYPNPISDILKINVDNKVIGSNYIVSDLLGRKICNGTITQEITEVSLQGYGSGVYLISIGDKIKKTYRFVKE